MQAQKTSLFTDRAPIGPDPGPDDLAQIRAFTLTDIPADRLYVRRVALANDAVDRQWESLPQPVLQRLADTLPGKSLLISHDKKQLPIGLWYAAALRPAEKSEAGHWTLDARFYILKAPENQGIRDNIDAGVIRHTSISFSYPARTCSLCGGEYESCPHMPGDTQGQKTASFAYSGDLDRYETKEASLVYFGAQKGSTITKDAGDAIMDELEKAQKRLTDLEAQLTQERATNTEQNKCLEEANTAAKKHRDEAEGLQTQLEALKTDTATKALIADGQAHRDHLKSEVKRLAGILHREKQIEPLLHLTAAAGTEALKSLHDGLLAEVEEKFPPAPVGNPMTSDKGDGGTPAPASNFSVI